MTRRKYESHQAIVNYWISWQQTHKVSPPWGEGWDWGEPSCMGCGVWFGEECKWSDFARCHVIPRSAPYNGTDEVSNLVLLCDACHALQPDSHDPQATYMYMQGRKGAWIWEAAQRRGIANGSLHRAGTAL